MANAIRGYLFTSAHVGRIREANKATTSCSHFTVATTSLQGRNAFRGVRVTGLPSVVQEAHKARDAIDLRNVILSGRIVDNTQTTGEEEAVGVSKNTADVTLPYVTERTNRPHIGLIADGDQTRPVTTTWS